MCVCDLGFVFLAFSSPNITKLESIWVKMKIVNTKYGAGAEIESFRSPGCSLVWIAVCSGREVFEQGSHWSMGDGEFILLYSDAWIVNIITLNHYKQNMGQRKARCSVF